MRQSTEAATVSAASPHPFCFNQPRTVTGEIDAARTETDVHVQVNVAVLTTRRLYVIVGGGPSIFLVKQARLDTLSYDITYPFDTATFTGATTTVRSKKGYGGNAELDVVAPLTRRVALQVLGRSSRGTVDFTDDVLKARSRAGNARWTPGFACPTDRRANAGSPAAPRHQRPGTRSTSCAGCLHRGVRCRSPNPPGERPPGARASRHLRQARRAATPRRSPPWPRTVPNRGRSGSARGQRGARRAHGPPDRPDAPASGRHPHRTATSRPYLTAGSSQTSPEPPAVAGHERRETQKALRRCTSRHLPVSHTRTAHTRNATRTQASLRWSCDQPHAGLARRAPLRWIGRNCRAEVDRQAVAMLRARASASAAVPASTSGPMFSKISTRSGLSNPFFTSVDNSSNARSGGSAAR